MLTAAVALLNLGTAHRLIGLAGRPGRATAPRSMPRPYVAALGRSR